MVCPRDALIDLAKDRGLVLDGAAIPRPQTYPSNLVAKDNSVPGSKQTATYLFSGAENPRVLVLNKCVVSRSPTLAGRDWMLSRL
jgi:hypothetical protein